jgi:multidrug efflux pump subunit AcrB
VQVASAFVGRTVGTPVGTFRGGDDPVPIVVRSPDGEHAAPEMLAAIDLRGAAGFVPVREVTRSHTTLTPGVVHHRNRQRTVSVLAEVAPGHTYAEIITDAMPRLDALSLPPGVRLEAGGAVEASNEANAALGSGSVIVPPTHTEAAAAPHAASS